MGPAPKSRLPFKLHFLVASFFNVVENLFLSPTAERKTTKVKGGDTEALTFKHCSQPGKNQSDPQRALGFLSDFLMFSLHGTDKMAKQTNEPT